MMKFHHVTKIGVLSTALFISFFELFTLLLLPHLDFNPVLVGLIDGFVGGVLAILLFNFLSKKGFKVKLWFDGKRRRLDRLPVFLPSLANGVFLAFLFSSEKYLTFSFISNMVFRYAVVGFVNTFLAMMLCVVSYDIITKVSSIRLKALVDNKEMTVESIDLLRTAFFVAIFEFFILPSMGIFFVLFESLPFYLSSPLAGFLGGFTGVFLASLTYNIFAKRFKGIGVSILNSN